MLTLLVAVAHAQIKLKDNIYLKKLANGLDVLVVEDNSVPLVTLQVTFKCGSYNEPAELSGMNGLFELMVFMGNNVYDTGGDLGYAAGGLGIQNRNNRTSTEYSTSYFTLPKENFIKGLNFMNSAVRFARVDAKELEKEKDIVDAQLRQKQSDPLYQLNHEIGNHLWGDLANRKNPIGDIDVVKAATSQSLLEVKSKFYYPNNAILIVSGSVTHEIAFAEVEKIYGDWKPSEFDPQKKFAVPDFKPLSKTDRFLVESDLAKTPVITVCWQGPDTRNNIAGTYAADVFSYIINQNSSQLNKALIRSGLATAFHISYLTQKYVGPITLQIIPDPNRIKECMAELDRQIELMDSDNYLTPQQIQDAKRILEIGKIREEEIALDLSQSLSFWWSSALLKYYTEYTTMFNKVSQADVKAYVQQYIKGKPYCAGLVINPELNKKTNAGDTFK